MGDGGVESELESKVDSRINSIAFRFFARSPEA